MIKLPAHVCPSLSLPHEPPWSFLTGPWVAGWASCSRDLWVETSSYMKIFGYWTLEKWRNNNLKKNHSPSHFLSPVKIWGLSLYPFLWLYLSPCVCNLYKNGILLPIQFRHLLCHIYLRLSLHANRRILAPRVMAAFHFTMWIIHSVVFWEFHGWKQFAVITRLIELVISCLIEKPQRSYGSTL